MDVDISLPSVGTPERPAASVGTPERPAASVGTPERPAPSRKSPNSPFLLKFSPGSNHQNTSVKSKEGTWAVWRQHCKHGGKRPRKSTESYNYAYTRPDFILADLLNSHKVQVLKSDFLHFVLSLKGQSLKYSWFRDLKFQIVPNLLFQSNDFLHYKSN